MREAITALEHAKIIAHRAKQVHHKTHELLHAWAANHHKGQHEKSSGKDARFHHAAMEYHKRRQAHHADHFKKTLPHSIFSNADTPMQRTAAFSGSSGTGTGM